MNLTFAMPSGRRLRREVAALAAIPCYDLAKLGSREVLVVGTGDLSEAVIRGLALLGVGDICLADSTHKDFAPTERRMWDEFLACRAPGTTIRRALRQFELLEHSWLIPSGVDLVVTCDVDGRLRAFIRRALRRCAIPWVEIGCYGSVCTVATYLPEETPDAPGGGLVRHAGGSSGPDTATAAVLGGLAAQEGARILLDDPSYSTLAGQVCLLDTTALASRVLESA